MAHYVLYSHIRKGFPRDGRFIKSAAFMGAVIALPFPETGLFNIVRPVFLIWLRLVRPSKC